MDSVDDDDLEIHHEYKIHKVISTVITKLLKHKTVYIAGHLNQKYGKSYTMQKTKRIYQPSI